jgi:tetraacyldisaccharide 4'-kinase
VAYFTSIARPDSFVETLKKSCFVEIVGSLELFDHAAIQSSKLIAWARSMKCRSADYLVCTEKDRVKIEAVEVSIPIVYVKVGVVVAKPCHSRWNELVARVVSLTMRSEDSIKLF